MLSGIDNCRRLQHRAVPTLATPNNFYLITAGLLDQAGFHWNVACFAVRIQVTDRQGNFGAVCAGHRLTRKWPLQLLDTMHADVGYRTASGHNGLAQLEGSGNAVCIDHAHTVVTQNGSGDTGLHITL